MSTVVRTLPVVLLLLTTVAAQRGGEPPRPPEVEPAPADTRRPPRQTISVDFAGGTLADFADALRAAGENVNIVLPESATQVRVPKLSLRSTTVEAALRALTAIVDTNVQLHVEMSVANVAPIGEVGERVYAVRVQFTDPMRQATEQVVRVFALGDLTAPPGARGAGLAVETILTALDAGLSVAAEAAGQRDGEPRAVLRYHEGTNLLFVAATPTQVKLVQEVLHSLRAVPRPAARPEGDPPPPPEPAKEAGTATKKKAAH
ncbi:MAG TPA: hypothetical protein VK081_09535 [Planctomycetota bacterium]|nr:hypothetical protein [Planctomycetota bacterium]